MDTHRDEAPPKPNWIARAGLSVVAVLAVYLLIAFWQGFYPFTDGDQPIIISDSSVKVRINGQLKLVTDRSHHRIAGLKVDHIVKLDSNNAPSTRCAHAQCDGTVTEFRLNRDMTVRTMDISEPNGTDTDLGVQGIAWDSIDWPQTTANGFTTVEASGQLIENGARCANCRYYVCFPTSGKVDPVCK